MTDDKLNEALALSRDIKTLKAMFDEQHKGHWVAITTADKKDRGETISISIYEKCIQIFC